MLDFSFRLSSLDVALILGNLEEICTFQQMLVQSLEECTKLVPLLSHHHCSRSCSFSDNVQTQECYMKATRKTNPLLLKSLLRYKDKSGNPTLDLS